MGLKDFFDTASAVEFGMTRAMDNARRYSAENETIQETRALLKDSERMLAELKAERTAYPSVAYYWMSSGESLSDLNSFDRADGRSVRAVCP